MWSDKRRGTDHTSPLHLIEIIIDFSVSVLTSITFDLLDISVCLDLILGRSRWRPTYTGIEVEKLRVEGANILPLLSCPTMLPVYFTYR